MAPRSGLAVELRILPRRNDAVCAWRCRSTESAFIVSRLLVIGLVALAVGIVMLTAGLAIDPDSAAGSAPIVPGATDEGRLMPHGVAALGSRQRREHYRREAAIPGRVVDLAVPAAAEVTKPAMPDAGRDPGRTDSSYSVPVVVRDDHCVVDAGSPSDLRVYLKGAAARANRLPFVDTAHYPRAPQENLPLGLPRVAEEGAEDGMKRVAAVVEDQQSR